MEPFKKILCPIDFSDFSMLALKYASAFAEQYGSKLVLFHCLPFVPSMPGADGPATAYDWQPPFDEAKRELEKCIAPYLKKRLDISINVAYGYPAPLILDLSIKEEADLIVMGAHGRTGYEAILMGSITNKVLHKTKIPVLTVCHPKRTILSTDPDEPLLIGKILCPVDPARVNLHMMSQAMFLARSNRATIYFLVVSSPESKSLVDLNDLIRPEKETLCKVEFLHASGEPVEEIENAIREKEIDLVVMGHRSKVSAALEHLGSVTIRLVPLSTCPVLVVRD